MNRVCYLFGGLVKEPITEITPTLLTPEVLTTVRQCDYLAHQVTYIAEFKDENLLKKLEIAHFGDFFYLV